MREEKYKRGTTYRQDFFRQYRGVFLKKYYFCAYCGKPLLRSHVTVDHIIPVGKVTHDSKNGITRYFYRMLLLRGGDKGVNSIKNLAAACRRCNQHKSVKAGIWVVAGLAGRHKTYWIVRWVIRILLTVALLLFLFNCFL